MNAIDHGASPSFNYLNYGGDPFNQSSMIRARDAYNADNFPTTTIDSLPYSQSYSGELPPEVQAAMASALPTGSGFSHQASLYSTSLIDQMLPLIYTANHPGSLFTGQQDPYAQDLHQAYINGFGSVERSDANLNINLALLLTPAAIERSAGLFAVERFAAADGGLARSMGPGAASIDEIPSSKAIADSISQGHAFEKHVLQEGQYGGITQDEFATHIQEVMDNPTMSKSLSNGRSAYYDEASGTVVITNPNAADWGTAFVPRNPLKYYNDLH